MMLEAPRAAINDHETHASHVLPMSSSTELPAPSVILPVSSSTKLPSSCWVARLVRCLLKEDISHDISFCLSHAKFFNSILGSQIALFAGCVQDPDPRNPCDHQSQHAGAHGCFLQTNVDNQ
jgi:hypothetical protein